MIIESKDIAKDSVIEADICIIGAGAAGISIASAFKASAHKVVLLEAGSRDFSATSQDIYDGKVSGNILARDDKYLRTSRLRYLGGTTNHWSGWCRPLDSIDFEKREWLAYSGWPISRRDLDPYYEKAAHKLLINNVVETDLGHHFELTPPFGTTDDKICTKFFHLSNRVWRNGHLKFSTELAEKFDRSKVVDLYLSANVTELVCSANGNNIEAVKVSTYRQNTYSVRAKHFILASGGIENARLLLCSNKVQKNGLGNDYDQVGRYFMEHPHIPLATRLVLPKLPENFALFDHFRVSKWGYSCVGVLCAKEDYLREHRSLNFCAELRVSELNQDFSNEINKGLVKSVELLEQEHSSNTAIGNKNGPCNVPVMFRIEQVPNPENRVQLDDKVDALGIPRTKLNWTVDAHDRDSLDRTLQLLAAEFGRCGLGRAELVASTNYLKYGGSVFGGNHHMGTTRMSNDAKSGVVDSNCKVHNLSNLFVASSSVFTTGGVVNPTYTIVALALRLADHLKGLLK